MAKKHLMIENSAVDMWKMFIILLTWQTLPQDNICQIGFQVHLKKLKLFWDWIQHFEINTMTKL